MSDDNDRIVERISVLLGLMANATRQTGNLDDLVLVARARGNVIVVAADTDSVAKEHIDMLVEGALALADTAMSLTGAAVYVHGLVSDWAREMIAQQVNESAAVKAAVDTTDDIIKGLQK